MSDIMRIGFLPLVDAALPILARELGLGEEEGLALDLAIRRFNAFARLQAELAEARGEIAELKLVDEAKRLLMKRRKLSEPEAYKLLRSHAMQSNQRIVEVARAIVTAEQLLGGAA